LQLFLLRAAGFLLPCYIMAWIFSVLHRRRQRQVPQFDPILKESSVGHERIYSQVFIIIHMDLL
jgi:hypothetical protein